MTKRFTWDNLGEVDAIADGDTFRWYLMLDGITDLVKFMNEQDERIQELESDSQWDDERFESIEGLLLEYESELPLNLLKEFYEIKEGTRRGN